MPAINDENNLQTGVVARLNAVPKGFNCIKLIATS
jgi:hypothetical protein